MTDRFILGDPRDTTLESLEAARRTERTLAEVKGGAAVSELAPEIVGGGFFLCPLGAPTASGYNTTASTTFVELQRLYFTKTASTGKYLFFFIKATATGGAGTVHAGCGFVNLAASMPVPSGGTVAGWVRLDMSLMPAYTTETAVYVGGWQTSTGSLAARISGAFISSDMHAVTPLMLLEDLVAPTWPNPGLTVGVVGSTASLSWNAATDNVAVTGYRIMEYIKVTSTLRPYMGAPRTSIDYVERPVGTTADLAFSYTMAALAPTTSTYSEERQGWMVRPFDGMGNEGADEFVAYPA